MWVSSFAAMRPALLSHNQIVVIKKVYCSPSRIKLFTANIHIRLSILSPVESDTDEFLINNEQILPYALTRV